MAGPEVGLGAVRFRSPLAEEGAVAEEENKAGGRVAERAARDLAKFNFKNYLGNAKER
jgi:hypothetical protein